VELAPQSPHYRASAAAAWLEANFPDRAVRDLRQALAFGDGPELRLQFAAAILRQTVDTPKDNRDWQAVDTALADVRHAHAKQPLKEPWRLALLEAETVLARANAEGRPADGVREAAAVYRSIKLDAERQKSVLPVIAMAFDRLGLHDDADRTIAAWERVAAPEQSRMLRAQIAAVHKNYGEARRLVEAGLDKLAPAERSSAQRFLVQLSVAQRDWQKARRDLDALTDFGPGDLELLFTYAQLAEEQQQPAEVERCRQKFIAVEGPDSRYGQFLQASETLARAKASGGSQLREVRAAIGRLTNQYPEWPAGLLLRARLLESEGRADQAADAYREAIRCGAAGVDPHERLDGLLSRAGRTADADAYQAAVDVPPRDDPAVRLRTVALLLRSPRREDAAAAEKLLRAVVVDSPDYGPARRALAGMIAERGGEESWKEARDLLHNAPAGAESPAANRRIDALLLIRRGGAANRQQAREILNDLVLRADADTNDRMLLAKLDDEDGRTEQARAQYAVMASCKDAAPDPLVADADFLLRHGLLEEADVQIRRVEEIKADDPAGLMLRARWLHAQHRDGAIGPLVEAAAERRRKASGVSAEEKVRQCMFFGGLYELCEQYAAAERWYRLLSAIQPGSFEPLAIVLAKQKRGGEAVSVCLDAAKHAAPPRPAMAVCAMRAASQIGDEEFQAVQSLVAAAEKDKPEPQFLAALADVRIVQNRTDEAIALCRRALAAEPENTRLLNNLATLLAEQPGHARESLELIDRAIRLAGPQSWLLETKGEILLHDGRVEEALALLKESASAAGPDPRVLLHLAQAYRMAGKADQARKVLGDAQKRNVLQQLITPADRKLFQDLNEKLRG